MNMHFYESLLKQMREKIHIVEERILSGSFANIEDYKYVVGRLKGCLEMESLARELFKSMNEGVVMNILDRKL